MKRILCSLLVCFILLCNQAAHATTIVSGTTYTGTIPSNMPVTYTFSGSTNQQISIQTYSAHNVQINLTRPDGSNWGSSTDRFSGALNQNGTYTVKLTLPPNITDGYTLWFAQGASSVSSGALTSGATATGGISTNSMFTYTFSGTSGQGFMIHSSSSYNLQIAVWKPDGSTWLSSQNGVSGNLPATGTYTVVVNGANYADNGAYNLYYVRGGDSVSDGLVDSGEIHPSTLPTNGIVSYQLPYTAGQQLIMRTGGSLSTTVTVYKPDGTPWTSNSNGFFGSNTGFSGTLTVVVTGQLYSTAGDFTLYVVRGQGLVSEGELISGQTRNGTMPLNGLNSYTFSGTSGQSLNITSTASYSRTICVFKPDGTNWGSCNTNGFTGTLGSTGEYIVAWYGAANTTSGDYTISLNSTRPAVTASSSSKIPCCGASNGDPSASGVAGPGLEGGPSGAPSPGAAPASPVGAPAAPTPGPGSTGDTTISSTFNINGMLAYAGNPINFDVGFKQQTAIDYQAGGLTFERIYRSDSSWTNNTVGTFWRHNYARTLNISGSNADIADGTGMRNYYTLSGSTWVPVDPSTRATLATITGGYKYTQPNGTVEIYNSSKQLTRIEFLGGGALNLSYNGSAQLTGIANENGRSLSLTYDGSGRVSTLVTPDGTFTYAYDANSNLSTVTKPDTKVITYHYENVTYTHALTGITDEKGVRYATYGYDSSGRANSTQHAGGVDSYTVTYNTGDTSTVTNPLGKAFTYYYKNLQGVRRVVQANGTATTNTVASSQYFNYDTLGRMIGKTDWNNQITRYQYDSRGNVTKIIEGVYTSLQRQTTITWDATFNLPNVVTEPGRTTDYDYDSYGRVTQVTITDTATGEQRITTYTYASNSTDGSGNTILGRLATINGPRTDVTDTTTYAYDTNFDLYTVTNALSQVTTVTQRDSAGRVKKFTDPNGTETDCAYNTNGRLTSVVQAVGTGLAATTSFAYDDDQQLTLVTLPNSATIGYTYDNAQRLTTVTDTPGNTINYTLDNAGNRTQTLYKNTTPTTKYTHTQTFDELSRLLHSVGASSQTAIYAWDTNSNLTSYTDPNTHVTAYTYDALLRLATSTDALSGVVTPGYNALDYVTSVKDQRNNSTTYTRNAFGDVTGETSPDRGTLSYTVNKAGNVTQRTDARSVVTNFTYDAINRLATVAYPSDSSLNVSLTYDASSGCGTPYKGHLCSVTDAAGSTAWQYDVLGRATQQKDTRSSLNFTTSYSYDLAGNITGLTLPSGRTVTYTLNSNGQVSGLSATVNGSSTTLASSVTYLPFGPLNALTYGNSLTFSGSFDQDYNPTNRTVSGSIYNWTYTTDSNGNITQAGATTYGYDNLNRVNSENPGTSTSYTYDATSNRLTKVQGGTTTTTVPSTSNRISAVGANSYTYDSSGNITADGVNTYTWNAEGELSIVKVSGTTVGTYTYNLSHQRAKKVAASTSYYVYGAGGLLYGEYNTSGNFIREYVYLNSAPLAQINAGSPEVPTYLHTDALGTPRFGTNSSGTQVWSWNNDAFGTSAPSGTVSVNVRMPGQYYDSESGLFYNWNRTYNPAIGRYISSDPLGLVGGLNSFGYVGQNPVMWIDPLAWADINPFHSGLFKDAGDLYNPTGYYSVFAHGGWKDGVQGVFAFGQFLTADELAEKIKDDHKNYHTGEPVVLVSCDTGGDFAEELSKQLGVEVIAPTGWVTVYEPQIVNGKPHLLPFTVTEHHWYGERPGQFISYPENKPVNLPY